VLNRAPYEFEAHVPHALKAGMAPEKIEALRNLEGDKHSGFTELERHVLDLTDAMTRDIEVPDSVFEPVKASFNEQQLIDLVATVASYNMVSRFLVALRIGH
jgi:4-carboxymuconolactone decarboxylase